MTLVNVNIHRPSEFGVSMCTTEMTEGYSMSPSTASSSGTNSGCLGSPINRMTPSISSPGKARETRETRNEMEDEDEISVGCPSPLPLVVATTLQDDDDDERLSSSREEYSERLTPRSYLDDDERYCSRDAVEYSLTPNIRLTSTRTDQGINSHSPDDNGDDDERLGNGRGGAADDYFKPLKRLKMVPIQQSDDEDERDRDSNERGVKSFSILDILSHRPKAKIVRPWDTNESSNHERNPLHQQQQQQQSRQQLHHHSLAHSTARDLSLMSMSLVSMSGSMSEPPLSSSSSSGRSSVSDSDKQANHLNLFNNRQQPKKKRKSRTAFTNQQIFELEKRFLYQKYLSPADRDEIAAQLGLSNAQVITWFQNRRAKLKRDMEELKKDVQTVNPLIVAQHHKTFLENVQDLGILKKRPLPSSVDEKS
ncbi:hypothetical protein PV328_003104 [Microctonus aethiopoides]|uniref:Homeobox domain-containing protein n=1 Tax=Microctonus aethiopoides TaxID=144406 RepID=A0AA39F7Q9_9HYME|nr:hypothetical protein PV328_003104 [Microctonus aethiopoides]